MTTGEALRLIASKIEPGFIHDVLDQAANMLDSLNEEVDYLRKTQGALSKVANKQVEIIKQRDKLIEELQVECDKLRRDHTTLVNTLKGVLSKVLYEAGTGISPDSDAQIIGAIDDALHDVSKGGDV